MATIEALLDIEQAKYDAAKLRRNAAQAASRELLESAMRTNRQQLTTDESARLADLRTEIEGTKAELSSLKARIDKMRAVQAEDAEADRLSGIPDPNYRAGKPHYDEVVRIGNQPSVYREQQGYDRNGDREPTFLSDLYASQRKGDPAASERLARHGREIEAANPDFGRKMRSIGTSAVSGFVPPQYLTNLFAEYARGGRPTANLCASAPLPAVGLTFQIPRITTATATAVQQSEGGAIGNQDPDDTLLQVDVRTIAGYVDVSRQALERGVMVESMVFSDLAADYNARLDVQVINGTGLNGQHKGLLNVSGINAITYTDATPTIPEAWPKIADAVGKVVSARFTGPTAMVMTPTMWAWILAEKDSTGRPLVEPDGIAMNPIATPTAGAPQYPGIAGRLFGVPVILDGNMPANLGAGNNETRILVADFRDAILFEDSGAPVQLRFEDVLSSTLQVRLVCYGYSGFAGGRQPTAISVVAGTGFIVPAL